MNYADRLDFYLGTNFIAEKFDNIDFKKMRGIKRLNNNEKYGGSFKALLRKSNNHRKKFKIAFGDVSKKQNAITLCKNRCAENSDSVILRCLNYERHWSKYYNRPADIPFRNKQKKVFWRGASSGNQDRTGNRFKLVTRWHNKDKSICVGFSKLVEEKRKIHRLNKYVMGVCNISSFLACKYILSVEGNDKDSGLQWKLNSNSVVLMAKPRVTTWLMETTLIPNVHYVLLADNFSDLKKKLIWCNKNQEKCLKIIQNANNFMKQFANKKIEEKLEYMVLDKYFNILEQQLIINK
jgi:hypothetical protein